MSKALVVLGIVGIICLSSLVFSLSPLAALTEEPSMTPGDITEVRMRSEVLHVPPAKVLAHAPAASGRHAYIAAVEQASGGQAIEVWSHNVDDAPHMLFNRFKVTLSDGSQVEESIGSEVRPGEWLHVTYRMPSADITEFEVELTEPGPFFDYVHDSRF